VIEVSASDVRQAIADDVERIRATVTVKGVDVGAVFDDLPGKIVARGPFVDLAGLRAQFP
jgi:hypothetical protein